MMMISRNRASEMRRTISEQVAAQLAASVSSELVRASDCLEESIQNNPSSLEHTITLYYLIKERHVAHAVADGIKAEWGNHVNLDITEHDDDDGGDDCIQLTATFKLEDM